MRLLLIVNPTAGTTTRADVDLMPWMSAFAGHTVTVEAPASAAGAVEAARRGVAEGYDRIIAVGGDGTVNCVASALAGTGVPLGILPMGTVNVLARELGIPLDPRKALQVSLGGHVRRLDLGLANGRHFTLMAGLGFDAAVVSEIVPRQKEQFGALAYITAGIQRLARHKPSRFTLTLDGDTFSLPAWLVVVGNASYYTYALSIAQDARMDDGLLDIIVFAEQNALDRPTQIGAVFVGQHIRHPNIRYLRGASLTVTATPPVALQLDGDSAGTSPVEISVQHKALSVMAPEKGREG